MVLEFDEYDPAVHLVVEGAVVPEASDRFEDQEEGGWRFGELMAFGDSKSRRLSKLRVDERTFVSNHKLLKMLEEISHDCM
jgi:hypothetical protein